MEQREPVVLDPAGQDPFAEAARFRADGPAVRVTLPGDVTAWYVTRHEVLRDLLVDDRVSKDPNQHWPEWINGRHRDGWLRNWIGVTNMLTAYGPDHRRLRKLVSPAFTARRTAAMRPRVERITRELLDDLAAAPPGETVDLRGRYAHPLPMRVICELFGVPEEHRPEVARVIDRLMDTTITPAEAMATYQDVQKALGALIELKRSSPADDMTSVLVAGRDEDDASLGEQELLDTLLLIIGAGHETTVNLIGNAVHALLTHPEQLALLRSGKVGWNDVIEETLRWAPSISALPMRFAVADIPLEDGTVIRAGDPILTTYGAAGHDPAKHGADADRFDASRATTEHLAFGHGVHHCLGAPLARMEAAIALPALFERFPDLALAREASELRHVDSFIAHGFAELPVRLTA
ncbi:cytochrome P450 [Streptomyces durbertensis]|uniref:Cytochrome P450 n=1 Tax=Streptomyces durbertensis TaxID=2448886 RepID=A0ABR6EIH8_9ACTN|nr:cytochrome P450 [Streptomyces durbertensis]MBB1245148.1 cytochrome P450 [Streptomyces durbertensis]